MSAYGASQKTLRQTTADHLKTNDLAALKKFGQNFLVDETVIAGIIDAADVGAQDVILEIGPGTGNMTKALSGRAKEIVAVEIDAGMARTLRERFSARENVTVVEGDILAQDLKALAESHAPGRPFKVVANLPYYITTPVLMKLLESGADTVSDITVMVQKEVALRMQAPPGNKDYGALSLAVQYYADCKKVLDVPPGAFYPPPKVDSAVVRLLRHGELPVQVSDEAAFFALIRAAFNQRRKTFVNAISAQWETVFPAMRQLPREDVKIRLTDALMTAGAKEKARAETLSLQDFAKIYSCLTSVPE